MMRHIPPSPPRTAKSKNGTAFVVSSHDGLYSTHKLLLSKVVTIEENMVHLNATKAQ